MKNDNMKVLLVAYAFPPIPYGGTYRCLRLCRGLAKLNVKCHVLTINQYSDIPNDYDLLRKVPETTTIHRTPIFDPWRRYQNIKKKHLGRPGFKFVNKIISLALRLISFPDHMLFWVPFAVGKAMRVIQSEGIDTVLVSSPPNSSQLVGLFLKKICKVKWIADFRDPIFGNVAEVNLINPVDLISIFERALLKKFEGLIVRNSDLIIANTNTHRKSLKREYCIDNVETIRNSYDPGDFQNDNIEEFDKFTISHIGSVYGHRNADILFAAIQILSQENVIDIVDFQVIFVGHCDGYISEKVKKYGIDKYVHILPPVTHKKAISLMIKSNVLLLIKATGKWSLGQIPGKFFEYAGARKRILCIGPKQSEVAELISKYSLGNVIEDQLQDMVSVLKTEYKNYQKNGGIYEVIPKEKVAQFSSYNMAKRVLKFL